MNERMRLSMNREHAVWQWVLQGTRDRIINGLRRRRAHPDVVATHADGSLSDARAEEPLLEAVRADTPINLLERIECDERSAAVCAELARSLTSHVDSARAAASSSSTTTTTTTSSSSS